MNERIKQIQLALNMSQKDFAEAIGIAPGALSNIYSGRTNATGNHVQGIHKAFPNINVNWLMFGEGEMYVGGGETKPENHDENTTSDSLSDYGDSGVLPFATDLFAPRQAAPATPSAAPKAAPSGRPDHAASMPHTRIPAPHSYSPNTPVSAPQTEAKKNDTIRPKIKEIRVFYDDGTYETFVPSK